MIDFYQWFCVEKNFLNNFIIKVRAILDFECLVIFIN